MSEHVVPSWWHCSRRLRMELEEVVHATQAFWFCLFSLILLHLLICLWVGHLRDHRTELRLTGLWQTPLPAVPFGQPGLHFYSLGSTSFLLSESWLLNIMSPTTLPLCHHAHPLTNKPKSMLPPTRCFWSGIWSEDRKIMNAVHQGEITTKSPEIFGISGQVKVISLAL